MIFRKEKVKDFPAMIFLLIFDFWAGTVWTPATNNFYRAWKNPKKVVMQKIQKFCAEFKYVNLKIDGKVSFPHLGGGGANSLTDGQNDKS